MLQERGINLFIQMYTGITRQNMFFQKLGVIYYSTTSSKIQYFL